MDASRTVDATVHIWWDLRTRGAAETTEAFVANLKTGIGKRCNLGPASRYRTTAFHQTALDRAVRIALPDDIDVLHLGPLRTVASAIERKAKELLEDWRPHEVVVWTITSDPWVLATVRKIRQQGYNVFVVTDFDQIPKLAFSVQWLEMYSYYVVARGDTEKFERFRVRRHATEKIDILGFKSPIVLADLKMRDVEVAVPTKTTSNVDTGHGHSTIRQPVPIRPIPLQALMRCSAASPDLSSDTMNRILYPRASTPDLLFGE